jgi:hypothetical protein
MEEVKVELDEEEFVDALERLFNVISYCICRLII